MLRHALLAATALLTLLPPPSAPAQVRDVGREGFTVDVTTEITASTELVWERLLAVGAWWHPDHTFWGDAAAMSIAPEPGGCFCEIAGDGRGAVHLTVTNVDPGVWLRLSGGLGPLQEHAVSGALTFTLSATETGTVVRALYQVGGRVPGGLDAWAEPVGGVLQEALDRLRRRIETGSPDPS